MSIFKQKPRIFDIRDDKWSHPELSAMWEDGRKFEESLKGLTQEQINQMNPYGPLMDPNLSDEEKREYYESVDMSGCGADDLTDCEMEEFEVPGCVEEPDTPAKVRIYRPKGAKKHEAIFYIMGGGMMAAWPDTYALAVFAKHYKRTLVVPVYRVTCQGKYPAAINDLHAAWAWLMDNGEQKYGINPDRVVIYGLSSGAGLACSLPFRLMRYGYNPRAIVAETPITDDRSMYESGTMYTGMWDGPTLKDKYQAWLGDAFASPTLPPEAMANRATVDDCIGYPPLFLHTGEFDPDRDNNIEFVKKVLAARSFVDYHIWGGRHHNILGLDTPWAELINSVVDKNISDAFEYDLRRPWVYEDEQD
jgi:acetyl esterase/lipase